MIPCATPASGAWSLWTMSHPTQFHQQAGCAAIAFGRGVDKKKKLNYVVLRQSVMNSAGAALDKLRDDEDLPKEGVVHRCPRGKAVGGPEHDPQCDKRAHPTRLPPLSLTTYMRAELCSVQFSSRQDPAATRTNRRCVGQEVDGQFVGSHTQP